MNLQGFYTNSGQALAAKGAAGTAPLSITRVVAGSGHTADIPSADSLPDIRQTLTVGEAQVSGSTATLPVTLAEAQAEHSYVLTELGVYAADPDAGEILFQVYQLSTPVSITVGNSDVLRFYLRQFIGVQGITVTCSPAGLLLDADLEPIRSSVSVLDGRVNAANVSSRTVEVTAANLQAYLDALPRLLTEDLTIQISGALNNSLELENFYGCGSLWLRGSDWTMQSLFRINDCAVKVTIENLNLTATSDMDSNTDLMLVNHSNFVWIYGCTFTGNGTCLAVRANNASHVSLAACKIKSFGTAVMASGGSVLSVFASSSGSYSNNSIGAYAYHCGIILLGEGTPNTLGGSSNSKNGGIIADQSGSLL